MTPMSCAISGYHLALAKFAGLAESLLIQLTMSRWRRTSLIPAMR